MQNDRLENTLKYINKGDKTIVFKPGVLPELSIKEKQNIIKNQIIKLNNIKDKKSQSTWKANIKRRYGLTIEEYDRLLKAQNNKCAICGNTNDNKKPKKLCIDHNHKTGKIRGLLCDKCNTTLGRINDDISILSAMISYLNKYL